ncbi:unnamed protein product [Vicia faba]|uniref:DUF7745 domain-containing protein n=1 Tax=Vicia faba TaxID=3906 RepID=A0AAV1AME8_VICFA|nr:unnamed protein product [Vicia faba]
MNDFSTWSSSFDEDMMKVLFQFFDPLHHYFTFPDNQPVPTMEEFSQLLGIPILDQIPFNSTERDPSPEEVSRALHLQQSNVTANWETRSGVKGFLAKFLLEKLKIVGTTWIYKLSKKFWLFSSMGWYYFQILTNL